MISDSAVEALFVSNLQRSDDPSPLQVRQAITKALSHFGVVGCRARVAQECGDHPDVATQRMRWARQVTETAFSRKAPSRL
jgi:hypothetical protein